MHNILFGDMVKMLDQGSQTIAVRRNHHSTTGAYGWGNRIFPKWQDTLDRVFQTLCRRQLLRGQARIARVKLGMPGIIERERVGSDCIGASPDEYLLIAILGSRFSLIQALERAIMTLIEAPIVVNGQIHGIHRIQGNPERTDGAFEHRGKGDIKFVTLVF